MIYKVKLAINAAWLDVKFRPRQKFHPVQRRGGGGGGGGMGAECAMYKMGP